MLAFERGFSPGRRVIEIERLEFVILGRSDRNVGIDPAIRREQDFVENGLAFSIDRQVAPQLNRRLAEMARVENKRIFSWKAGPPIAPEFEPERAAFERVDTFIGTDKLKPQ